jgi:hypothetical protein
MEGARCQKDAYDILKARFRAGGNEYEAGAAMGHVRCWDAISVTGQWRPQGLLGCSHVTKGSEFLA